MSLSKKYILILCLLAMASATITGILVYRNIEKYLIGDILNQIRVQAQNSGGRLQQFVGDARNDVLVVANSPDMTRLVSQTPDTNEASRLHMGEILKAQLRFKPNYLQFRYIGRQNDGKELVRVDRSGPQGQIWMTPFEQLQVKGDRNYYQETIPLPRGQVYVSPIDLNQEFGVIEQPEVPVIRFGTPIYKDDSQPEGIVVLNLDMRPALNLLRESVLPEQKIYLLNDLGQFLLHPDPARQFRHEYGENLTIHNQFPDLQENLSQPVSYSDLVEDAQGDKIALGVSTFQLAGGPALTVMISIPYKALMASSVRSIRQSSIIAIVLGLIIAFVLAALLSRSMIRPIKRLTRSIQSFQTNGYSPTQIGGGDEIQHLAHAYESMSSEVEHQTLELEREIKVRKEAELKALDQAEKLKYFEAVIQHSDDAIITKNLEGIIEQWNPAAERLYGFRRDEAVGKPIHIIVPPDFQSEVDQILKSVQRGEKVHNHETVRIKKSGELVNVSLTISPVYSPEGEILSASIIVRDITEKKRTEEQLNKVIEACPGGLILTNDRGEIVLVNIKTVEMFGYAREELIGQRVEMLMPSEKRESHKDLRRGYMNDPQTRSMGAGRNLQGQRKDGTTFPIEVGLNPIHTTQGLQILAIAIDITEQKKLNDQLRQAQKMEGIGRLAGGVAHDFNNLLTVINGCTEMLLDNPEIARNQQQQMLEEVHEAGGRAANLTRQLLAFSRKSIVKPAALNVNTVIENLHKMLGRLIGEDIELRTVLSPAIGRVMMDPTQLEQVIVNLAINARDAMPKGGNLTFETMPLELKEKFVGLDLNIGAGPYVVITVSDNGLGMTEETRQRIFEPFFTTKESGVGTGLGLAMIYGIVQQCHGAINVYSEPGQGTTFKIYLPSTGRAAVLDSVEEKTLDHLKGTETILLAEDESGVRHFTKILLESYGYRVIATTNGSDALEQLNKMETAFDLLLTDVVMPKMSGQKLSELAMETRPGIKVIFMSGYTDDALLRHGIFKSRMVFVQKPFTAAELLKTIRETLDAKH